MGGVFAAVDQRLGRAVALKMLRPDLAADARARERFLREAMIAASIRHPNVVRTFDVGDAPQGPYLIQELLEGRTLGIEQLPPRRALAIVRDIASALRTIHEQGFVHCDVKPANIMLVDGETRAVLLDFGIARDAGADASSLIATPLYLAPERAFGAAPTAASDLYSLGIVLYVLLSGQPPFNGTNIHALLVQHQNEALPPLALADPSAKALEAIAVRLAAKQPSERYSSAAELLDALQRVEDGAGAVPALPMSQPAPRTARSTSATPLAAGAAPFAAAITAPLPAAAPAPTPAAGAPKLAARPWWALPLLVLLLLGGTALMHPGTGADALQEAPLRSAPATVEPAVAVPASPAAGPTLLPTTAPQPTSVPPTAVPEPAVVAPAPIEEQAKPGRGNGRDKDKDRGNSDDDDDDKKDDD